MTVLAFIEACYDEVSGFVPAEVSKHHFAGEDYGARVYLVEVCVFWGGSVGSLENGVAGSVVYIAAGGDTDAADLRGEGVGDVVAVEV